MSPGPAAVVGNELVPGEVHLCTQVPLAVLSSLVCVLCNFTVSLFE